MNKMVQRGTKRGFAKHAKIQSPNNYNLHKLNLHNHSLHTAYELPKVSPYTCHATRRQPKLTCRTVSYPAKEYWCTTRFRDCISPQNIVCWKRQSSSDGIIPHAAFDSYMFELTYCD